MQSLIESLRTVLGEPQFYVNGTWDYGLLTEYLIAGILLCLVVSGVFKFIRLLVK